MQNGQLRQRNFYQIRQQQQEQLNVLILPRPGTPINGARPQPHGSMTIVGILKERWQAQDGYMVKGINVAYKLRNGTLGHVRQHVRSLHSKLLICSNINPNVFGVCLKIGRTRVPHYLLKRLRNIIKNCIIRSRLRMIFLYQCKI